MTVGITAYNSIANEHPWIRDFIPDSIVRSIDTTRSMYQFGAQAELNAVTSATKVLIAHNAGVLAAADYEAYANFRRSVYETQVAWVRSTRAALYDVPGGYLLANRIPWPTWLPVIRADSPRMGDVIPTTSAATSGTSGLGAAPAIPAFVLVIAAILALGALAYIADVVSSRFATAFQASVQSYAAGHALERAIDARSQAVQACISQGGNAETCRAQANAAVPSEVINAINNLAKPPSDKGFLWYVGAFVVTATVLGGIYYGHKQGWFKARGTSGVRGLGSPTRLRSLRDPVPSKYGLEIDE